MKIIKKSKSENIKGILFALVISFSIWIYSLLNYEYSIYISVPLNITVPEKYSISGKIPENLDVLISAVGWQILNLTLFPKGKICNLTIDKAENINDKVIISKNDFIKSINLGVNAKILDVNPGTLVLEIGKMVEKVVPVVADIEIVPRDNFIVVGNPIVKPEFVTIKGKSEVVEKIDRWKTARLQLHDVHKPVQIEASLSDSLRSQISFNVSSVMVYVDVDFAVEKKIYDIPIRIEGGNLPEGHVIEPKYLTATIRSGVNKAIESDLVRLDAKINYSQLINDTIGIIEPKIELPSGISLVSVDPAYIYHWISTKQR
jgi:hypothetical protein